MSDSGVSLNWGGFDKAIGNAVKKMASRKALMASVGEALVSGTIQRFDRQENPKGQKWQPSRRAVEQGGQTLSDTGRLRKSIDYAATPKEVMVGSNAAYARIHQMGGKTGKGHKVTMPARPFLGVSDADMDEVRETISDFLKGAFK